MLRDIKKYIQEHKRVSLRDIALHFDVDPGAIEKMVAVWVKKGIIKRIEKEPPNSCHGCTKTACDESSLILFEWFKSKEKSA